MWDKNLDEGIFLCEHNSHILTTNFLESLNYVQIQKHYYKWIEPTEFIINETDFIAYILLQHSNVVSDSLWKYEDTIPLSNRRQNEIFHKELTQDFWENQFFIYKLFYTGSKLDTNCARCGGEIDIWHEECDNCKKGTTKETKKHQITER